MLSRWLSTAMVVAGLTAGLNAAEIEIRHINDLFSASPLEDDLYTATLGISTTVDGWTFDLDEYLFTDKSRGMRFDETYLAVARDLLAPDSKWNVRARLGVARVGQGLYGQRLQNFVHSLVNADQLNLTYIADKQSHVFVRLNVERTLKTTERATIAPVLEIESAGFKKHARIALGVHWNLGRGFELYSEAGARFTETNFAPLSPWIKDSDPTFTVGVGYQRYLSLTWTSNYFGTGDRHWHLTARAQWGHAAGKRR